MELMPFQKKCVDYLIVHPKSILALDMGLGKTIVALMATNELSGFPLLVICPSSLKINWEREVNKWLPRKTTVIINNQKNDLSNADVIIINYDILSKHLDKLLQIKFKTVILDEAHKLKNEKSIRTKNVFLLAEKAKNKFCLSGTPVVNGPIDLVPLLKITETLDEVFEGFWKFVTRFCNATQTRWGWDFKGASNSLRLHQILREHCYIRFEQQEVLKELPPKTHCIIELELTNKITYRRAEQDFIGWYTEKLSEAERKKLNFDPGVEAVMKIEALKQLCIEGKIKGIIDWITTFLESGEKLVVFAHHKKVIKFLGDKFKSPIIIGETPMISRQKAIDAFQNDNSTMLIFLGLESGGEGLTLTKASKIAFLEYGWTPKSVDQAIGRVARIGQRNPVTIYSFAGKKSIDLKILRLIEKKRKTIQAITNGINTENSTILDDLLDELAGKKQTTETSINTGWESLKNNETKDFYLKLKTNLTEKAQQKDFFG